LITLTFYISESAVRALKAGEKELSGMLFILQKLACSALSPKKTFGVQSVKFCV
jgi:uncharacterized protein (DUF1810 family)